MLYWLHKQKTLAEVNFSPFELLKTKSYPLSSASCSYWI